jgi:hypothetical protein
MLLVQQQEEVFSAASILGQDFIAPLQLANALSLLVPCAGILEPCWPPEMLTRVRELQCLILPGPPEPYSIQDMLQKWPEFFWGDGAKLWYGGAEQKFAAERCMAVSWLCLGSGPVGGSLHLDWKRQQRKLNPENGETVPNAVTVVWTILLFLLVYERKLFADVWVRTSSRVSISFLPDTQDEVGSHVYVGTEEGKIILGFCRIAMRNSGRKKIPIGLALSMNLVPPPPEG